MKDKIMEDKFITLEDFKKRFTSKEDLDWADKVTYTRRTPIDQYYYNRAETICKESDGIKVYKDKFPEFDKRTDDIIVKEPREKEVYTPMVQAFLDARLIDENDINKTMWATIASTIDKVMIKHFKH